MKKIILSCFLMLLGAVLMQASAQSGTGEPWTAAMLKEPAALAGQLELRPAQRPVIIDVGPAGVIIGAEVAGPAHEADGMKKLKNLLQKIPRDKEVVIYCGCCPFEHCPNVRPAFKTLLEMGFKHPRLLDLPHNLKADWIDKGYPVQ